MTEHLMTAATITPLLCLVVETVLFGHFKGRKNMLQDDAEPVGATTPTGTPSDHTERLYLVRELRSHTGMNGSGLGNVPESEGSGRGLGTSANSSSTHTEVNTSGPMMRMRILRRIHLAGPARRSRSAVSCRCPDWPSFAHPVRDKGEPLSTNGLRERETWPRQDTAMRELDALTNESLVELVPPGWSSPVKWIPPRTLYGFVRRLQYCTVSLIAILLAGCSSAPRFRLFEGSDFSYPTKTPIKIFFPEEIDMGSGYWEKIEFFELPTVRELVVEELRKPVLRYSVSEPSGNRVWRAEIPNCFTIVDSEDFADIIVSIAIEKLAYGDPKDTATDYATYMAMGLFGLVASGTGPRGYLVANVRAIERSTGRKLHSFQVGGVSDTRRQQADALREAIEAFAANFNSGFLRHK